MHISVRLAFSLMALISALAVPLVTHAQDESQPTFVKGKFDVPLDRNAVKQEWKRLGYSICKNDSKEKSWARGEHTHPRHLLFAGKAGKMEFIINDQRFVLEAGDELYYPKDAVISAQNLYDGNSEWFECLKFQ